MPNDRSKPGWGGARKNAGRKRIVENPRRLTLDFDGDDFERMERLAERREESVASIVREAVRRYLKRTGV